MKCNTNGRHDEFVRNDALVVFINFVVVIAIAVNVVIIVIVSEL